MNPGRSLQSHAPGNRGNLSLELSHCTICMTLFMTKDDLEEKYKALYILMTQSQNCKITTVAITSLLEHK